MEGRGKRFTGQRPNIRVKGGSIDGEIIFSGNVLPLNDIENYTPPSSRLVYDSGEPRLFFRSDDGKIYDSYANAIKDRPVGGSRPGSWPAVSRRATSRLARLTSPLALPQ